MLILAPMQGLTEILFRKTYSLLFPDAFDYAISPFLSITHGNLRDAGKKVEDVLPENNQCSMPVVPQLLGHECEGFVELSNRLYELGYNEVNWNMGCPMRRVAAKHRGSGILPYPDEVDSILSYVIPRIKPSLSVKVRLGYNNPDDIDKIIPILNRFPLKDVTVHPRIGRQLYSGVPNLDKLEEILPEIKHKVIYNGDIFTAGDYGRIRARFPQITDVMIGRGALYNPLLPLQIRQRYASDFTSSVADNHATPYEFINTLIDNIITMPVGNEAKCRKIKEYWCLLSKSLPGTEERKRRVLHADCLDAILREIFSMTK